MDALHQGLEITTGQVSAPNAALEYNVPAKANPFRLAIQDYVSARMARRVAHFQAIATHP